ncbi:MAG: replicative DNA helicase [Verrucomicrobia bacterium]|nr:replicative DNA helicase [Verrucomicrobiota bacterium]
MIDSVNPEGGGGTTDLKNTRRKKPLLADPTRVDRLPPHSLEAEQGVLGCVLLSPNECLGEYIQNFKDALTAFYDLRHQCILECLVEMYDAKEPIDLITLQQKLRNKNQLESIGGLTYLSSLADSVPSAANLNYYLEIVREKYLLRRVIQTCTGAVARVYEHEGEVDALLDEIERDVLHISEEREKHGTATIKELVHKAINTIEDFHQRQGMLTGLSTGFPDLDKLTSGLHGGEMIVIAARPSMGKTSLAMNVAESIVIDQKLPVGVFSLEMTAESLVLRMLCSRARVNLRDIRDGFLAERDFPKLTGAAGKMAAAPLYIDDTPGLSILQLRARARRMAQQHGVKLFVIDYLQLLHSTSARRVENRQQEIADISNGVKALAKELDVPVIVLSQLNRELERDKSRKPRLSDLRESGAIEQDADLVALLYKPNAGDDDDGGAPREESDGIAVNLLIAKQRNGPTGEVYLTFLKGYTRFESAAKVSADDLPVDA